MKTAIRSVHPPAFCPQCGYRLSSLSLVQDSSKGSTETEEPSISFIQGHEPNRATVQFSIGPYRVIRSIGKGGMGEVLLAYDTICGRKIALKRVRTDLLAFRHIQNRFLREARITSQLTHPSVIPIYTIHQDEQTTYYTMPFVEGETLKQILRRGKDAEKKKERPDHVAGSIPALVRIFLSICQAIAYAHSKNVLHRDLKPENIIVGQYGEVMILDWGLAKLIEYDFPSDEDLEAQKSPAHHETQMGKVVGTLGYMAPERALGSPATKEADIYALGVILYQILTLKLPFRRGSLKQFREKWQSETLVDPITFSPYRDIPKILAQIAMKCLAVKPEHRYNTVDELIFEIENYIEGRAEWFQAAQLSIQKKEDWEFQEHILIAEHTAITRTAEISEWVQLMISKASFAENVKIETKILLHEGSQGIGFLFNIPEASEREEINDGYCLWLSSEPFKSSRLLRSSIEISSMPEVFLSLGKWNPIRIEKVDNTIRLFINEEIAFTYISRKPLVGTHIGILARDSNFEMDSLCVFVSSQNIMVNCLSIPDAFLAHKEYPQALSEYRRIGYSFPGRAEGREAILRSGITLIEQAKNSHSLEESTRLFDAALEEFEKLHETTGAPLEYLGKALVYEAQKDVDEEIKCFELAYRRFPDHPLLQTLQDQILFRLMECSRNDRKGTYHFLLLTLNHIPNPLEIPQVRKLATYLEQHWEPLDYFSEIPRVEPGDAKMDMQITLAFWLHKNYALQEVLQLLCRQKKLNSSLVMKVFLSLALLDEKILLQELLIELPKGNFQKEKVLLSPLLENSLEDAFLRFFARPEIQTRGEGLLLHLADKALDQGKFSLIYDAFERSEERIKPKLLERKIWALLLEKRWEEATNLFQQFPYEMLTKDSSILHYLYGCLLYATEGSEISDIHYSSILDTPFPRSWSLATHYLMGKLEPAWFKKAFDWERWQLERQLSLFEQLKQRAV